MKFDHQHPALDVSQPVTARMIAATVVGVALGFVLFSNSPATARQTNALSGSGEVLQGKLPAPSAGHGLRDPSVPDAAEALRGRRLDRVHAVNAPTF
jgi:hypothetical protein